MVDKSYKLCYTFAKEAGTFLKPVNMEEVIP